MNGGLEDYLALCRPFELPAPWSDCPVDENSLRGPADPQAAWTELLRRHAPEALLAGGLAQIVDGQPVLHPHLAVADVGLVALRNRSRGRVRNLVTNAGCLIGDTAPLFEVLGDQHTYEAIAHGRDVVFLAETITDVVLLRSFGWTAATAVGIERFGQPDLEMLAEYYGIKRESRPSDWAGQFAALRNPPPDHGVSPSTTRRTRPRYDLPSATGDMSNHRQTLRLILVRGSLHDLDLTEPPAIRQAVAALKRLQQYRRLCLDQIRVWSMTAPRAEAIRFALSSGEPTWVRSALLDDLEDETATLASLAAPAGRRTPATELAQIRRRLQEAQHAAGFDANRRSYLEALADYHRMIEQREIGPLLEQAQQTSGPYERALRLQFIELYSLYLAAAPEVRRKILVDSAEPDAAVPQGRDKHVAQWLAMGNQLLKLHQEIKSCQTRSTAGPSQSAGSTWKGFPRFRGLG